MILQELGKTSINLAPLAIGTSTFGNVYGKTDNLELKNIVKTAIDNGLNYFDTSPYYGNKLSEINLGNSLEGIERSKFIISTKVGRYGDDLFDFSESTIISSLDESLGRLKIDYVDILLLHDIEFGNFEQIINESLPALEKLKNSGKVKYIGFSCYPINLIKRVVENSSIKIDVILSYAHYCLLNNKLTSIIPFLKENNIGIINASPLCMGLLTTNSTPDWHPASYDMIDFIKNVANRVRLRYMTKIENYALAYPLCNSEITTTLVGIRTLKELEMLINILHDRVIFRENVFEYIFDNLAKYHNIELE